MLPNIMAVFVPAIVGFAVVAIPASKKQKA
jgi:hypothetical protein